MLSYLGYDCFLWSFKSDSLITCPLYTPFSTTLRKKFPSFVKTRGPRSKSKTLECLVHGCEWAKQRSYQNMCAEPLRFRNSFMIFMLKRAFSAPKIHIPDLHEPCFGDFSKDEPMALPSCSEKMQARNTYGTWQKNRM
jgi:hypothetical protein